MAGWCVRVDVDGLAVPGLTAHTRPMGALGVFVLLLAAAVVARLVAARWVRAGHGSAVWLVFAPVLVTDAAVVVLGLSVAADQPLVGIPIALIGAIVFAVIVNAVIQMAKRVSATPENGDLSLALTDPLASVGVFMGGLFAMGGLVAVVALIVWGLSQPR
jgi:hypothetical protein